MKEIPTYKWTDEGMRRTDIDDETRYFDYTYVRVEDIPALNPPLLPAGEIKWYDIRRHHKHLDPLRPLSEEEQLRLNSPTPAVFSKALGRWSGDCGVVERVFGWRREETSDTAERVRLLEQRVKELEAAKRNALIAISRFQDELGWQEGESRNALVGEIWDRVNQVFMASSPAVVSHQGNASTK